MNETDGFSKSGSNREEGKFLELGKKGFSWALTRAGYRLFQRGFALAARCLPWRQAEAVARPGAIAEIPGLLALEGGTHPLVVTGPHLYASGLTGRVLRVLEEAGVDYEVFFHVPPDPTMGTVEAIAEVYRQVGCDCFVAVGGGSPMDGAKGAAARIARPDRTVRQLGGLLRVRRKIPPLIAVPTTAGTGSETTIAAVITEKEKAHKYAIMDLCLIPRYAVLDPELTMGLYTKEEMQDNDFKEYPMEDLQEQVKRDIAENANSEPFVVAESEASDSAAVDPEKVVENDENVPYFMKD